MTHPGQQNSGNLSCAIAGAGPTGLTLAIELARRGHRVRIFDRSPGPRPLEQSRALGILPPTLTLLEPCGLTKRLLDEGVCLTSMRADDGTRRLFEIDIKKGGGRWPFLLSLQQGRTEQLMCDTLSALGVEVEWNTSATTLDLEGERPVLVVEGESGTEHVAADQVAGCDGVRSPIRQELEIPFEGDRMPIVFSLADAAPKEKGDWGQPRIQFKSEVTAIELPLPGGLTRIIAPHSAVHERADIRARFETPLWASDFEITFAHVERMCQGNVFLAGDAAHVHSPAGGRGMNIGIADAAWLAWCIHEGREAEYQAVRLPVAQKVLRDTRLLTRMVAGTGALRDLAVRHLIPFALRFNWVERRVAAQLLADDMPHPPWIEE